MRTGKTTKNEEPPSGQTENTKEKTLLISAGEKYSFTKKVKCKLLRLFGVRTESLENDVVELIEEHDPDGKQVGSEERNMLSNIFGLSDLKIEDIMIPRTDIIAVDDSSTLTSIRNTLVKQEHTRIPVYRESLDNVTGFIHIKDLIQFLSSKKQFSLKNILREILYVPPSMKVLDLLVKMRAKRVHMALVVDEYGGTCGLVTMEDLMEEIVGEIEDEHDEKEIFAMKEVEKGTFEVNARMEVEDLGSNLGINLKNDDYDTIGGMIFFMLGRVPEPGEKITSKTGLVFEILDSDKRRIKKVLVKKNKKL